MAYPFTACNINTFIAAFCATKVPNNLAISRPAPCGIGELVDVLLAVGGWFITNSGAATGATVVVVAGLLFGSILL